MHTYNNISIYLSNIYIYICTYIYIYTDYIRIHMYIRVVLLVLSI